MDHHLIIVLLVIQIIIVKLMELNVNVWPVFPPQSILIPIVSIPHVIILVQHVLALTIIIVYHVLAQEGYQ